MGPGTGALDDGDQDGANNFAEYKAGTDPTNSLSVLKITQSQMSSGASGVIAWQSVTGKSYDVKSGTNLWLGFPDVVKSNVPGAGGTNSSTVQMNQPVRFFRVRVE
jgi:hypothetical protein